MKIIDADNTGGDYPDEKIVAEGIKSKRQAEIMCEALNKYLGEHSRRYCKIVEDDYRLDTTRFEP